MQHRELFVERHFAHENPRPLGRRQRTRDIYDGRQHGARVSGLGCAETRVKKNLASQAQTWTTSLCRKPRCTCTDVVQTPTTTLRARAGHAVVPIIMESFGGLAPGAVRLLDELARAHGSRLGKDELTAPWCARSFKRLHVMRITIALHCAAADEILQTVQLDAAADADLA